MKPRLILFLLFLAGLALNAVAQEKIKIDSKTSTIKIIMMDPAEVDPSALPLTTVASLHATGTPQDVDVTTWRLTISGTGITPLSMTYDELSALPMTKKRVLLICPGFFYDYLEWEGVPLTTLLAKAGVTDYRRLTFTSVDGYTSSFRKSEVQTGLILVALKGNGVLLPKEHGFPARVVAEGISGGRWVKYLTSITLE
jgi:DMSO/TMAO reductase YedYZ molybdopterin-dependent catalytic subunit